MPLVSVCALMRSNIVSCSSRPAEFFARALRVGSSPAEDTSDRAPVYPRTVSTGHAFVQNLRRGHYAFTTELAVHARVRVAFGELALSLQPRQAGSTRSRRA
ncbi:MAG: hypothetical protein DLM58_09225 [Pseudonocardiales bacterium]|nr:MAG: hypothetical protein DLM58_09225 [Pseudonocardiales bacterium]